jgi:hypothetical protein
MKTARRHFVCQTLLALPLAGALASCKGSNLAALNADANAGTTKGSSAAGTGGLPGIQGTGQVSYSPLAKPPKLQPFKDPDFGTSMVRITDAANDFKAGVAMPAYPTTQAWNCDETRLILYVTQARAGGQQGWAMFDGKTYAFLRFLNINPSDIEQFWWSHTDPTQLLYISNYSMGSTIHAEMVAFNVETGAKMIVHDFMPDLSKLGWPVTGPVRAGYPFANGGDNRIWGLGAGGIPNIDGYLAVNCFGLHLETGAIIRYQGMDLAQPRTMVPAPRLTGKGWFWNNSGFSADANYETWVLDIGGNLTRKLSFSSNEHLDSAMNGAGQDVLVGVQYDTPVHGNMILANLETGVISTLIGKSNGYGYPRTGSFTSCTAYQNPTWIAGAAVGSPFGTGNRNPVPKPTTLLDQEVFIANIDSGAVSRVAHHRSTGSWSDAPQSNYWAQPNVTISPSGTRILVQSDWGCADPAHPLIDPNAVVDTYVITLPPKSVTVT